MQKVLCIVGAIVAILLLLMFGLDFAVEFPFGRVSPVVDVGFLLFALTLGYVSWAALMEQQ